MLPKVSLAAIKKNISLVGVLNVTPDSFSDGATEKTLAVQIVRAKALMDQGAALIDIGGDSTRPGSVCVGSEEEWERIGPLVKEISSKFPVSVDTHHPETAQKALSAGAIMINDISGGDEEMFKIVARHNAQIVLMHSRCSRPHVFDLPRPNDLLASIGEFFEKRITLAAKCGVKREQLIFDPGMGAFLSADPDDSYLLIKKIQNLKKFSPLYVGVSRKGFLTKLTDETAAERDSVSALVSALVLRNLDDAKIYLRSHSLPVLNAFVSNICGF